LVRLDPLAAQLVLSHHKSLHSRCQSGANFAFRSINAFDKGLICNAGDVAEWLKAAVC
jgi:hypothetical protein